MTRTTTKWRHPLLWFLAALSLWLAGLVVDRRTEIVIESLGQHLRFAVAGTELVVPDTFRHIERITLQATDSIDPPSGRRLELRHDGGIELIRLAGLFPVASEAHAPIGDWWVDVRSEPRVVVDHEISIAGAFSLQTVLRGRFVNDLTITLHGIPTMSFTVRRGLLDNYLVIRHLDGSVLAATTIDPTPMADSGALAAQILRGVAAACLVVAFVGMLMTVLPIREAPAKKSRAAAPSRRPPSRVALTAVLFLAVTATGISVWVAVDVLDGLPHQIDEVVYLLQARWLLDGEVAPAASTIWEHHGVVPFTHHLGGRWIGHYPVGWPFLLAVGLAVDLPHLVNPVLGAGFILLLFLVGREIDDDFTGLAAAAMGAVSPLARVLSGSMFSHIACAVLVLLAVWLLLLARRCSRVWFGAGAGLAMGACLAVRPMTAVIASVVLGGWMVIDGLSGDRNRHDWGTIAAATAAGLAASLPTLIHNAAVTGSALALPYSLGRVPMYALANIPFGLRNLDAVLASIAPGFFAWGWPVFTGGLFLALPLGFVVFLFLRRGIRSDDVLLAALLVAVALAHLPTKANGLHGYGARYVFDVGGCLFILTARGFRELGRVAASSRWGKRSVVAVFVAINLTVLATLPTRLGLYRGYDDISGELERQVAATGLEEMVILVEPDDWWPWGEAARLITGSRRHEIVVAVELEDNSAIERAYPDRPVFRWVGEHRRLEKRDDH